MGWGRDEDFVGCLEGEGKAREQVGESRLESNRGEDAGAEHGVAGESVEKGVVGSGQVGVYPLEIGELLDCPVADKTLFALPDPF